MSSSAVLWHCVGRVLAWVTLLFAVGTGGIQPLQALVGRFGEPGFWTCFEAQRTYTASSRPRPRRDASFGVGVESLFHDLTPCVPHWNCVLSIHMRCRMTASFLATATTARRCPRVLAICIPQAFKDDHLALRVSMALAAVYSAHRTSGSPALEMWPGLSISPDWERLGVSPK